MISGLLIDKRRLMAVPTTTKSLLAKNEQANQALQKTKPAPMKKPVAGAAPKQFTKIIKKTPEVKPIPVDPLLENDDDDFEDDLDDLDLDEITSSFEDLEDDED